MFNYFLFVSERAIWNEITQRTGYIYLSSAKRP